MIELAYRFQTLAHDEQILHLQQSARDALLRYGIRPESEPDLLQYENNAVFRVVRAGGEGFVLRISTEAGRSAAEQLSEMHWLAALRRDTDLAVPEPVADLDGALVTSIAIPGLGEPLTCVCLRWIPGRPPGPEIELAVVERIGAVTARLHQHAERFVPPARCTRPSWDWQRLFGASSILHDDRACAALTPAQRELVTAVGVAVRDVLDGLDDGGRARRLIHADLHRDNVLIDRGEVGVIDFDDCGWGYFAFDLASLLDSFARHVARDLDDERALRDAYLQGYESVRALPAELERHAGTFKVMRDMVNIDFILRSNNANVARWGPPRLGYFYAQLETYLEGSPRHESWAWTPRAKSTGGVPP